MKKNVVGHFAKNWEPPRLELYKAWHREWNFKSDSMAHIIVERLLKDNFVNAITQTLYDY